MLKSPALLGSTYKRNGGWRVTAFIEKRNVHGPLRTTEAQAEEDLAAARAKASHQEFGKFLRDLASSASEAAAGPAAAAAEAAVDDEVVSAVGGAHAPAESPGTSDNLVFLRILETKWSHAAAAGKKFVETQRYMKHLRNQMNFAKPGMLLLFGPQQKDVRAGQAEVAGVAVLAGRSIQGKCPDIAGVFEGVDDDLHADLRQYLLGAGHSFFEYVKFSKVFDLRHRRLSWCELAKNTQLRMPRQNAGFPGLGGERVRAAVLELCASQGIERLPAASVSSPQAKKRRRR